jgi:hypothetical protein
MAEVRTIPWNTADHLDTPEDIAAYLEAVFEDGDPELISHALVPRIIDARHAKYVMAGPDPAISCGYRWPGQARP